MKRDIFKAILRAAKRGTGLRLSPEEVRLMSLDDAIECYESNHPENFAAKDAANRAHDEPKAVRE